MGKKFSKPAISFLLCTRNRAETARECVLNLLKSGRSDIEVVVRDNFSTDNTLEVLNEIKDSRLKIYKAPENQGTRSFFEITKLASGRIVTWLSDEDDFEFEHLDYILSKFDEPNCNVLFGSIIVGPAQNCVQFPDETAQNAVRSNLMGLGFSGCGGIFIRSSCLSDANSFNVSNANDAYMLWNNYPVGFFASRCINSYYISTSKVVVKQTRFAKTTNNWNALAKSSGKLPHYYPESVFDRLASNIVNVYFKKISILEKIKIVYKLVDGFYKQAYAFNHPNFIKLLKENYDPETVENYLRHIDKLNLGSKLSLVIQTAKLVYATNSTRMYWRKIIGN